MRCCKVPYTRRGSKTFASLLNKLIIHLLIKAQVENEAESLNTQTI